MWESYSAKYYLILLNTQGYWAGTLSDYHVSPFLAEVEYGSVYRAGKVPCLSV